MGLAEHLAEHQAEQHMQVLTSATDAGRGGSRTRGAYMGHVGEKRPRSLERLTAVGTQSAVDMSLEHEYSD